jgi:hypothetical protein
MARKYVIEHMEEDDHSKVPPWVYLEYRHILELVHDPSRDPTSSPASSVLFSSLSEPSCKALQNELAPSPSSSSRGYETTLPPTSTYEASTEPVLEKMKEAGLDISRVCLLDPKAEKVLEPGDGDRFDWFLFGGILGGLLLHFPDFALALLFFSVFLLDGRLRFSVRCRQWSGTVWISGCPETKLSLSSSSPETFQRRVPNETKATIHRGIGRGNLDD